MPRFISLLRFTDAGAKDIKRSTNRAHSFDAAAEKAGVKVEAQYWTIGPYDGVLVINAPDELKALHLLSELSASGNVRSETMIALSDKEFEKIVS